MSKCLEQRNLIISRAIGLIDLDAEYSFSIDLVPYLIDIGVPPRSLMGTLSELPKNLNAVRLKKQTKYFLQALGLLKRNIKEKLQRELEMQILGKDVLILGPSNNSLDDNIDWSNSGKVDTVVRINIKSIETLPNIDIVDKKTDIVYLNGKWSNEVSVQTFFKGELSSAFVVLRHKRFRKKWRNHKNFCMFELDALMTKNPLLMFPRVLVDILSYRPRSLSVAGVDFYSSKDKYYSNFGSSAQNIELRNTLQTDLLSNLAFVNYIKRWSSTPLVFLDFNSDLLDYATKFDRNYNLP